MASNTPNLNLYKKNPVTDGEDVFNIETMLNENWDKIDKNAENTSRKNKANGYMGLGSDGRASYNNLPSDVAKTGQLLPNGTNLDDVKTEGVYFTNSAGNANTMQNTAQANVPFSLCVTVQTARIIQEFTTNDVVPRKFIRTFALSAWQAWREIAILDANSKLPRVNTYNSLGGSGSHITDLDTLFTSGVYPVANNAKGTPMSGEFAQVLVHVSSNETHNNANNWIWQMLFGTGGNTYVRRKVNNGAWQPWVPMWTGYNDAALLVTRNRIPAGANLNTITDNGVYSIYQPTGTTNIPPNVNYGVMVVFITDRVTGYLAQQITDVPTGTIWTRTRSNNTWTAWKKVEDTTQKNVANGYAGLDSKAKISSASIPYGGVVNLLGDSGRFMDIDGDPKETIIKTQFKNNSFFLPWNGTTVTSGGKFIYDNTTNGGAAGALTEDVISLIAAVGLGGSRYGTEYYIASYTMGTGKANAGNVAGTYLMTTNSAFPAGGVDKQCTISFWIRVKSGKAVSIPQGNRLKKNGVIQTASHITLTPADGWVHIEKNSPMGNGYGNAEPNICATAGDVVQIAMPVVVAGAIGVGVHITPVMGASLGFVPLPAKKMGEIANGTLTYAGTTKGTATALTASVANGVITSLVAGDRISFKTHVATSSAVTLNLNGLGAKPIKKPNGNNPNLALGGVYTVIYDGSAFILQGEGGEYGQVTADKVLSGVTFGTENGLSKGTMPDKRNVATDAIGMATNGADIYLNTPEGYYNPVSSIRYRENTLADPKNWRSDRTLFGKQGAMPVRPAQQAAKSTGENNSNVYARIPLGAYMTETSPETAEIVIPYSMLANNESTKIKPENIRAGAWIYGVQGTLQEGPKYYQNLISNPYGTHRMTIPFDPIIIYVELHAPYGNSYYLSAHTGWQYTPVYASNAQLSECSFRGRELTLAGFQQYSGWVVRAYG